MTQFFDSQEHLWPERGAEYEHRDGRFGVLISSHPHDGACLVLNQTVTLTTRSAFTLTVNAAASVLQLPADSQAPPQLSRFRCFSCKTQLLSGFVCHACGCDEAEEIPGM